jgi:hypothetical protein
MLKLEGRNQKPEKSRSGFEFLVSAAGVTQLVESQPSKLLVAGSSPVSRSKSEGRKQKAAARRREMLLFVFFEVDTRAEAACSESISDFCFLPSDFSQALLAQG